MLQSIANNAVLSFGAAADVFARLKTNSRDEVQAAVHRLHQLLPHGSRVVESSVVSLEEDEAQLPAHRQPNCSVPKPSYAHSFLRTSHAWAHCHAALVRLEAKRQRQYDFVLKLHARRGACVGLGLCSGGVSGASTND